MRTAAAILFLTLLAATPAAARPVSYADGWMMMTMNDAASNGLQLLYSPTARLAVGPVIEHWRDSDAEFAGLQANALLHRWNNPDSQANLYLLSNIGIAKGNDDEAVAFSAGIEADWENRRFYLSYENKYSDAGDIMDEFSQKARIGIAPYVAEYGGLHTWFMLQADHRPEGEDGFSVTPLLRFFKDDWLAEAGVSNHGAALFNLTFTF